MAALSFLLLLLPLNVALLFTSAASRRNSTILPDSFLTPATQDNAYLLSPSGIFAFGFYPRDGGGYSVGVFMVGIPQKTVVWTADRDGPPVPRDSTLRIASRGLVLQSTQSKVIASPREGMAVSGSMLDTGNFVLYNSQENITWQSFDYPTDTILGGQHLSAWDQLFSSASESDPSTGKFRIRMQEDGNLVMFPINTPNITSYDYWNSGTSIGVDTVTLNLAGDGLLYLLNGSDQYLKNFTSRGHKAAHIVYRARLDPDGIFRLYSYNTTQKGDWSKVWSATEDGCRPMGLCGINSYCVTVNGAGKCMCLPGFDFVRAGNETSGCKRSLVAPICKGTTGTAADFDMEVVPNFSLEDDTYAGVAVRSQDECQMECQQECNCEAAIYQGAGGLCRKQRLPIRYAKKNLDTSDALIVKVAQPAPDTRPDRQIRMDVLVVSLCFLALATVIIIACAMLLYRNRALLYSGVIPEENGDQGMIDDVAPRSFTYDELAKVTRDFSEEIGKGSFGVVYRGNMSNGRAVAVKKLIGLSADGEREFQAEMKTIARTHHRNLVRLLGYSVDGSNRLLVYEYMSNGSLADLLFTPDEKKQKLLRWEVKMAIVRNIARGLLYLHEECETQIIHCDIKPGNILIDECHCAKISDFGLSKLLKPDQTNTFTNIRGTRGYVAPEWHKNLPVTTKADVYSFGIVLLEIVCSRRNMDQSLPEEEIILEHWVYDCFQAGELTRLVDEEEGAVDKRQLERMVKVAIWCTMEEPSLRPSMRKVLLMLEGTIDIPAPPCPTSFLTCI